MTTIFPFLISFIPFLSFPMSYRPRLPLDPFAGIEHDIPWSIPKNLPHSRPQLILIIGEPPINHLIPLLTSLHLSRSLVLIATHTPPSIPPNTPGPAIRILRLSQPLAVHDSGALRLVNLLERAQRVAHFWPRDPSLHVIQLAQSSQTGDFSVVEPVSYLSGTTELEPYPSPASSTSGHGLHPQSTSPHKKLHRARPALKNLDDKLNYKSFDAIINFIPYGLPDKAILKHAILVTTISAQFLASPTCISTKSPSPITDSKTNSHRQSQIQNSTPFSPVSSSNSHSSASESTSSPSGSTPVTSPSPSPPPMVLPQTRDLSTAPTSKVKNRFSLLFRTATPSLPSLSPSRHDFRPLPEVINLNDESWKVKNAHLVHILPAGWAPDSGTGFDRGDKRASSSNPIPRGPNRHPHLAGYSKITNGIGGQCKPKLVQSIEQFLLSFAYPLGSIVSGNFGSGLRPGTGLSLSSSPASNLNISLKTARILSPTSIINESITPASPRPQSSSDLNSRTRAYEQHNSLNRTSILSVPASTSNCTISLNIDTPPKPVPYLLAAGVFGRCAPGSNRSHIRSGSLSESGVGEDDSKQSHEEDTRSDAYTDPEATALSIGEIILLGALDFDHTRPEAGPGNGRAWIGNVGDVVFVDGGSGLRNAGVRKGKGREMVVMNAEMTKTAKSNVNVGLQTPPESLSSNNSAEGAEEEQVQGMSSAGHTRIDERHIPPALSTHSSPTHLDNIKNLHWQDQARTPSGSRSGNKVDFNTGVGEALVVPPTLATSTTTKPKATGAHVLSPITSTSNSPPLPKSMAISRPTSQPSTTPGGDSSTPNTRSKLLKRKSSLSTPTSTLSILNLKQTHVVKDKGNSPSSLSSLPLPSAVQVPPLVVHRDRACSPRRSGDNHDLELPVPSMTVSMKPGSRSTSGSGLGSSMERGRKTRSMYGGMRSSMDLLEESGKGSERKGFVGALKKLGLWL